MSDTCGIERDRLRRDRCVALEGAGQFNIENTRGAALRLSPRRSAPG